MLATLRVPAILVMGALAVAGCADTNIFGGGNEVATASVAPPPQPKIDPACNVLANQIDTLRREGVADKIEKAAAKKYKMTPVDLSKADQLTKYNADFQTKCSTVPRQAAMAAPAPSAAGASAGAPGQAGARSAPVKAAAPAPGATTKAQPAAAVAPAAVVPGGAQ